MKTIKVALAIATLAIANLASAQTYKADYATKIVLAGSGTSTSNTVTLLAPTPGTSTTWTLPSGNGTSGWVLTTDGNSPATLSWTNPSTLGITSISGTAPINVVTSSGAATVSITTGSLTTTTSGVTIGGSGNTVGSNITVNIASAKADGSTMGLSTYTASDFNDAAGVISLDYTNGQKASGSQPGFLSSADWTTFNNKQSALTTGNLTASGNGLSITGTGTGALIGAGAQVALATGSLTTTTSGVTIGGSGYTVGSGITVNIASAKADGTTMGLSTYTASDFNDAAGVISLDYTNGQKASGSQPGFLSSADWTTFNGKQSVLTTGNLTASGNGLSITGTGTGAVIGSGVGVSLTTGSLGSSGSSISVTGSGYTVGANLNVDLNTTHANSWSGIQTFNGAGTLVYTDGNQHNNYVLTSDANGVASWTSLSGVGVTAVNGTSPINVNTVSGTATVSITHGDLTTSGTGLSVTGGSGAVIGSGAQVSLTTGALSSSGALAFTGGGAVVGSATSLALTTDATLTQAGSSLGIDVSHSNTWTGAQIFDAIRVAVSSPTALGADQTDWAPSLSSASHIRVSASTSNVNINGIAGGADGRVIIITNVGVGPNTITLISGTGAAGNQVRLPNGDPIILGQDGSVTLIYDATGAGMWRLMAVN